MAESELLEYIKRTRASGFSDVQIRQALFGAGWTNVEIQDAFIAVANEGHAVATTPPERNPLPSLPTTPGFFSRHAKTIIVILAALIVLPLVAYGGLLAYQKFSAPKKSPVTTNPSPPPSPTSTEKELIEKRDRQRVKDVGTLQTALGKFYETGKVYPKTLTELVAAGQLDHVLLDPKTNRPYLYTPIEDPALHYAISFLLENDVGSLAAGLQVVTAENKIEGETLEKQDELIKGEQVQAASAEFSVTDLSKTAFRPLEEIDLEITIPANLGIDSVHMVVGSLDLTDRSAPYGFRFSAPKAPGEYQVNIFAFDLNGKSYYQSTNFTVKTNP